MIYVVNYGTPLSEVQLDVINSLVALGTTPAGYAITKDGSGNFVNTAISGSGITLETNGVANTDQTTLNLIAGSNITLTADAFGGVTIDSTAGGSGTVTTVSVVSANGFAGSVANATTTPAITLSTTITGLLKGNGTAISAAVAGTDYEVPLTFSTGLTRTVNTVTVNTTQNIAKLSNLTSNGFVKTSGGDGTLSIDTNTYITGNQTITLSGDVTGSGATSIVTAIGAGVIVDADINASAAITLSKLAALTASRVLVSDGSGVISASSVSTTTLGYLDATSSIQTQLNAKQATGNYITALTGDVTASGPGSVTSTIANDAVTYAKMQNVSAASKLLGRGSAGGSGDVEEITIGSGLSMSGTTLSATGGGSGTVTSVAATVPTGLTISGSPITTAGTLAIGLDTGYVIPLQSTLDAKVPYTGATANVDLGTYDLITDTITAKSSAGLVLENASGGDVLLLGAGGGVNATAYGGWNFDSATANTIASFGASKTLTSLDTATYPSLTELSYVKGVTSSIQTQLNAKVDDGAVTTSGLTMSTARILGRTTASTGAIEEISIGSGLSLSAGTLSATGSGTPAGANTQIQYNNSGAFGASSGLTWDDATDTLGLGVDATIQSSGVLTLNAGGDGNYVEIYGKNATSTNNSGGDVYIATGVGDGAGSGGLFSLSGGNGGATGNGGNSQIEAGSGGLTSGNGGSLNLKAGFAQAGNGNGGSIQMYTGDKDGSGTAGEFRFYEGVASSVYGVLNFKNVATTSKTFTFPNTTGTVALTSDVPTSASSSDINTGTSTTKFNTPDALAGSYAGTKSVSIAVFAPTTDVATGDGKAYITIPEALNGMNLVRAQATVVTAGTTNATTVMIRNKTDSVDMLSGAISIASGGTVGTVGTINTSTDDVATNDVIGIDVDSVSTTAPKGLMIVLEFRLP